MNSHPPVLIVQLLKNQSELRLEGLCWGISHGSLLTWVLVASSLMLKIRLPCVPLRADPGLSLQELKRCKIAPAHVLGLEEV